MNDEKRRNARLQGRFSDETKPSKKEKSKRKSDEASAKKKNEETKSLQPADGIELHYDEKANMEFPELEVKKPPVEINTPGEHILSQTENGTSRVIFEPDFLPGDEADLLMTLLRDSTKWYDKNIIIHGEEVPQPRLVAWYGPLPYAYSGAVLDAAEMPPAILKIKDKVEKYLEAYQVTVDLNSVLLNLYRDGKDSVAWHSDDELSMGVSPTIASVSLGEIRKFQMRIKPRALESVKNLVSENYFVNLTPGSLLIMDGSMQADWKHQVPKEYHDRQARINLTFRTVYPIDKVPLQVPLKTVTNSNHPSSAETEQKTSKTETHIFDNTNFPSLDSANSQNGNSAKVPKNSSAKSKSKAASDAEALSNQSSSESSVCVKQEQNSESDAGDNDYQSDTIKKSDTDDECVSASALPEPGEMENSTEDSSQASKRYELNANADEFIPKCPLLPNDSSDEQYSYPSSEYFKQPMAKLPDLFRSSKVPPSRYNEFYSVLMEKIEYNPEFLTDRDHYELETLSHLYENGLSERNQKVVLDRLCSMIKNAKFRSTRGGYRPPPPPRSGYRNTYSRSRGPYKSSTNKD